MTTEVFPDLIQGLAITRNDCFQAFLNMCMMTTPKPIRSNVERICISTTIPFIDKVILIEEFFHETLLINPASIQFKSRNHIEKFFDHRLQALNHALRIFDFEPTNKWFNTECPINKRLEIQQFLLIVNRMGIELPRDVRYLIIKKICYA